MKKKNLEIPAYMRPTLENHEKEMKKAAQLMALSEKYANGKPSLLRANVSYWIGSEIRQWEERNPIPSSLSNGQRAKLLALKKKADRGIAKAREFWERQQDSFLAALEEGNDIPFFEALKGIGGVMIFEPRISAMIQDKILSSVIEKKDRDFLVRLGRRIKFVEGRGEMPQLDLNSQHKATLSIKSKSAAVTRLVHKYNKWVGPPFKLTSDDARRQVEQDFQATTRFSKDSQQEIIKAFREKIKGKRDGES